MGLQINSKKLHIYNSMYDIYLAPLRGPEVGRWLSTCMDLIDLTQSDSENEREIAHTEKGFLSQTGPIEHVRKLPLWASASGSNSKRSVGISQRLPVSELYSRNDTGDTHEREERQLGSVVVNGDVVEEKALYIGNGDGSISSDNGYARRRLPPNFIGEGPFIKISGSGSGRNTQNLHGIEEASLGSQSRAVQSNGYPVSEAVDKPFTWHTSKRTIPHSFQPAVPTTGPQVPMDKRGDGLDFCGRTYHSVGVNEADRKAYEGDNLHVENDDVVLIYENGSTRRQLPPSVTHGKSVSTSRSTGFSDTSHRMGVGEERPKENDERLIFQAALQDLSQPKLEANLPDGLLIVPLLRHQRIALAWMVQKETNSFQCLGGILADDQGLGKTISTIALILMQRPLSPKSTSDASQHVKSEALNLDEDDDVVNDLERIKQHGKSDNHGKGGQQKVRPAAGTLVVCPASVLRQWARELEEKIAEGAKLSVLIYHGGARTKDPIELAGFDVVLTTYSIVSNEVPKQPIADDDDDDEQRCVERYGLSSEFSSKKRKKASNAGKKGQKGKKGIDDSSLDPDIGTLARVGWFRVVLDEAQTIKNHKTQVARACCGLRAKRRWCLSGTPIQNSIDDLYSYFRFLKYDPYAVYKSFCAAIKYPISRNATNGYKKLQAVLKTIMLRRTKGTLLDGEPIIKLPPKSISLKQVDFSAEERTFYSELEADSRQKFKAYAAAGTVKQNYANILLMLLRLRQACDHPLLVKNPHSDSDGKLSLEMARKLSRDTQISLLNHLEASLAICGICNDTPENAVVTICGHVFCYQCVCDRLVADDNLCPATYCKAQIGMDSIFFGSTLRRCISGHPSDNFASFSSLAEESEVGQGMYSSKIKAALEIVQSLCKSKKPSSIIGSSECEEIAFSPESTRDPALDTRVRIHLNSQAEIPEKAIIFSQWTKMLDLLEIPLKNSGIQYRRLDGTMSLAARDRAVKDYTTNPEVTVIIMSLKAGNLGLNMVAACHVLLLDLWWNPTTEDQAIDRAHRIGQTRPVTVSRLTIKDTVEDRILALQEDKRQMVASAFGEDQTGSHATRLTVEDLRYLFMV